MKEFLKKVTVDPWFFLGASALLLIAGFVGTAWAALVFAVIFGIFITVKL